MPEYRIWCPPTLFAEFNQAYELEAPETQKQLSEAIDAFQALLRSPEIRLDEHPPTPTSNAVEMQIIILQIRFAIRVNFAVSNVWLDGITWLHGS
ncbi:MAG: hypothetical protein KY475_18540 [Planctomycetes bacterium]|nr:hypothetical protein [Planctomycetota bacterium]